MSTKPAVPGERPLPHPGFAGRIRLQCMLRARRMADHGRFGLRPCRTVVVCGLPRSGTTLLHLMLQTGYPHSKHFSRERSARFVARYQWPGRYSLLISKRPSDVYWIDEVREWYRDRILSPRFIVATRDPRAVLTSKHLDRPGYYVNEERWRAVVAHIRYVRNAPDVFVVDYRDLVQRPRDIERHLVEIVGEPPAAPLDSYTNTVPQGFRAVALNGVRPIDTASLDKWREPQHAERIRSLLVTLPELPEFLIEEGYEPDDRWADSYR